MRPAPTARRFRFSLRLASSTLVLGCGHRAPPAKLPETPPAPPAQAQPVSPAPEGSPKAGQVPRIMVFAGPPPGMAATQAPAEPEKEPEPTVGYASLQLACDSVEALAKRRHFMAARADGVPVDFGFGGPPRAGCELKASGKFVRAVPDSTGRVEDEPSTLADGFKEAGWAYMAQYQADGPDGEAEGWRSKETTCVLRWSWDGGDDSDSTYVPSDDWDLVIGCAPWAPEDSRRD
jgi:hypothetical protein